MIIATFDLRTGWTFDGDDGTDFGIRFTDGGSVRVYPDGLAFGYTVIADGSEVDRASYPPSNIVIREIDADYVYPYRIEVSPDSQVTLLTWVTNAGVTVEGEAKFTAPRPPQPYTSWTWEDRAWTPPVAHPGGDAMYVWDEDGQIWATSSSISEQGDN